MWTPPRWSTAVDGAVFNDVQPPLPSLDESLDFSALLEQLASYLDEVVDSVHSFEDFRLRSAGRVLDSLTGQLLMQSKCNELTVCALVALRGYYTGLDGHGEDVGFLNASRAAACEVLAWRFTAALDNAKVLDYLLVEVPPEAEYAGSGPAGGQRHVRRSLGDAENQESTERSPLLSVAATGGREGSKEPRPEQLTGAELLRERNDNRSRSASPSISFVGNEIMQDETIFPSVAAGFVGLNALEIAVVVNSKNYLSQSCVQRVIDDIWKGHVVFWNSLSVNATKKARRYNDKSDDPYCRLRVPRYIKLYEVLFFAALLGLYYSVLIARQPNRIPPVEVVLIIWIIAFAYDELGQYWDAGLLFYAADFWSLWDFGIILIGVVYFVILGLVKAQPATTDLAFDVLSLEALLLVPSLHPFFGPLIPCLKEMTKYSAQFIVLVFILYLGFLTTFTLLARDQFTPGHMSWILIKVFFGSSYLGFDIVDQISPIFGAPLMVIFVFLSSILLLTALISLLSNSLSEVMARSREEYLLVYSVYVLEASTSNRLTYYFPPINLVSLMLRPLRFFVSQEAFRSFRITILKLTHFPHVLVIRTWEVLWSSRQRLSAQAKSQPTPPKQQRGDPIGHSNRLKRRSTLKSANASEAAKRRANKPPYSRAQASGSLSTLNIEGNGNEAAQLHAKIDKLSAKIEDLIQALATTSDNGRLA